MAHGVVSNVLENDEKRKYVQSDKMQCHMSHMKGQEAVETDVNCRETMKHDEPCWNMMSYEKTGQTGIECDESPRIVINI